MKQITQVPADLPYQLVNFGVDTLVLNVRYADDNMQPVRAELPEHVEERLNAWQTMAKEREEPVAVPLVFHEANLLIYPHGAGKGQWRWLFNCPAFKLYVGRGRLNGVVAQVRLAASYLWSCEDMGTLQQDIWPLIVEVGDFLTTLFGADVRAMHLQVSEVHLCADIAGWDVARCDWQHAFLSRARRRTNRAEESDVAGGAGVAVLSGRRLATLEFGAHGSPLSCSMYNKSLEIKSSGKVWFEDIWKRHGWDGSSHVWRVEFRWKREALHEIKQEDVFHGIESINDLGLAGRLAYLWTYAAGHTQGGEEDLPDGWLRYAQPSDDTNSARWLVHPAWVVVQSAFCIETEPAVNIHTGEVVDLPASPLAVLIRERQYQVNVKRLSQQIGGCASTLAAWLGSAGDDLPTVFAWLVEHLPGYVLADLASIAPPDLLRAEYDLQFADTVGEKRVLYGLQSTYAQ
ncbi:MAG: hypothetical protein ACRDHZ_09400 [Ktedonobacteraceae bacterium]